MNLRVFVVKSDLGIRDIASKLSGMKDGETSGFRVHRTIDSVIEGNYFVRRVRSARVLNSEGVEESIPIVNYDWFSFQLDLVLNKLILFDSPRDVRAFITALCSATGFKLVVENWRTDLSGLFPTLSAMPGFLGVVALDLAPIQVNPSAYCLVTIKGSSDVTQLLRDVSMGKENVEIERLVFRLKMGTHVQSIDFNKLGRFRWRAALGSDTRTRILALVKQISMRSQSTMAKPVDTADLDLPGAVSADQGDVE